MSIANTVEKFHSYVASQGKDARIHAGPAKQYANEPALTISYQAGVDVLGIAGQLTAILEKQEAESGRTWSVLDQQLIETALAARRWPKDLAGKLREHKRFVIDEWMDDLLGLCPPSWEFVPQLMKTTLQLAMAGQVILVGHGATIVTSKLSIVFHVRLTGSLSARIERIQSLRNLAPKAAAKFITTEDLERKKYLKTHFRARLDNELLYDVVINTDRVSNNDAAGLIFHGARDFFSKL